MNNENALRILISAIPVFDRAARVEATHHPEMRSSIRNGVREYKAAVKYIKKQIQPRDRDNEK